MGRDDIGSGEEVGDVGHKAPTHRLAHLLGHVAVVVEDNLHAEGLRELGHLLADVAESEEAERLALHLKAAFLRLVEGVGPRLIHRLEDAAAEEDHLSDDQLGNGAAVGDGIVDDQDATIGAGPLVDRVVADAAEHHGKEVGRGVEDGGRDLHARPLEDELVGRSLQQRDQLVVPGRCDGGSEGLNA